MKYILFSLMIAGCSGSSGGGGASAGTSVQGVDMTGVYQFVNISCFSANGATLTQQSIYSQTFNETIIITGNAISTNASEGGCTDSLSATFVFSSNNTLNMTGQQIASATGGKCQMTLTLNNSSITPTSSSFTFTKGETKTDKIGVGYAYFSATKNMVISSIYSDGISGDTCYEVWQKQ